MRTAAAIVILGGALAVLGAFGSWIRVSGPLETSLSSGGMSGGHDGPIVLVIGLLAVAFGATLIALGRLPVWVPFIAIVGSLLLVVTAVADTADVHSKANEIHLFAPTLSVQVGWGLILSVVAGVVILGGAITSVDLRRQPRPVWPPTSPPPPYAT